MTNKQKTLWMLALAACLCMLLSGCAPRRDLVNTSEPGAKVESPTPYVAATQAPPTATADTGSQASPAGKDVVELVNLRGDETTAYKLADGRYMDRIDRIFLFDGVDTWTDEGGAEWNEIVR